MLFVVHRRKRLISSTFVRASKMRSLFLANIVFQKANRFDKQGLGLANFSSQIRHDLANIGQIEVQFFDESCAGNFLHEVQILVKSTKFCSLHDYPLREKWEINQFSKVMLLTTKHFRVLLTFCLQIDFQRRVSITVQLRDLFQE